MLMMAVATESSFRGKLSYNESMKKHTSWRVGGLAERFYRPADSADLVDFLMSLSMDEPLFILGLGSNLLVRDAGISGTVVLTKGCLTDIQLLENDCVLVEAGVSCAKVARFAARNGLLGAEFLAGIPGTMGGALAMNAGAFGRETWQCVDSVKTIDRFGQLDDCQSSDFAVSYRQVNGLNGRWFLSAILQLSQGDAGSSQETMKNLLSQRNASQPIGLPSCGSVFRNPKNDFAARLIESCGLKGCCMGGACVSEKHANFIINTGNACAGDIEDLIAYVQQQVQVKHHIKLRTEVHMVGERND